MKSQRWFIATNTENLKFFYDCGLIVDRQAFPNDSYMHDMQAERPKGYIPCFSLDNLTKALKSAKREDENLTACLVEIELKNITFKKIYARTTELREGEFDRVDEENLTKVNALEILLPAPLPLSCVKSISVSSIETQKSLSKELSSLYGVFPARFIKSNTSLFKGKNSPVKVSSLLDCDPTPKQAEDITGRKLNYTKAFAYGGALSLGFYQTKNGRLSSRFFEALSKNDLGAEYCHLRPLICWVFNDESRDELETLYSLIFNLIAEEDDLGTCHYDLLKLFNDKEQLPPSYTHVRGLAVKLQELVERTHENDLDAFISKLIDAYESKEKGSSKVFLLISLLFIRDHSETLLKFYHERFSEEDYFLIAVFFGLVKGVSKVPEEVKKIEGLRDWVSFKMAELMSKTFVDSIAFQKEPPSPVLIHNKYLKKSSIPKVHDALQKFSESIGFDESEIIAWILNTKDEYKVKAGCLSFSKRPKLLAEVDHDRLESLMLIKTIKEKDELFDFNKVFKLFKA